MLFKVAVVLATLMFSLTFSAQQKDDPAKEDKPLSEGNGHWNLIDVRDVLMEVLSFCPPINWAWLRRVNSMFNVCLRTTIGRHFEQHGVPLDPTVGFKAMVCSEEWNMEDVLKSVMDKPGFRGAIFNKDECTLINHSLRGSQVCSEKGFDGRVRITGVADVKRCGGFDQSNCNDCFLYRVYPSLHARNIRNGKDITIDAIDTYAKAIMANEKQLVILDKKQILMYELDWGGNTAECVLRENKEGINLSRSEVLTDQSGKISSVLCHTGHCCDEFDTESNEWKTMKQTQRWMWTSPDGKIIFRSENGISIETMNGETTLLRIPGSSSFEPSPDSKFVQLSISSKQCIMNLRSSEITVIEDIGQLSILEWVSENMFRWILDDGRRFLRSAHNPCVDVVTLSEDDSVIKQVRVDDEVDASDLFYHLKRIGPNLYAPWLLSKVIQVQWMDNHKHKH